MRNSKLVLLAVLAIGFSFSAQKASAAGYGGGGASGAGMFMIGVSSMKVDTQYSGTSFTDNGYAITELNVKAGYIMGSGLYLGGIYDSRADETTTGTTTTKSQRTSYGATIGYHNSGWFIDGSYFLSSTYKPSSGSDYTSGSGFGIDLGHNWDLTANIYLGLQLAYKSITYTKHGTVSETNKYKSELMPMVNVGVMF